MDNKTSFIMKEDEGCENNDYATLEIPTKIFHDMAQYDVQTVAHIDIPSPNLSAKYWTTSEYQTAEGHSIAEISTEGDTLQTDGNVNLQTCDMTEKIPSSTVARSRINVETAEYILNN